MTTFPRIGVLVGRDLIGDALMKLPFVRALRRAFPDSEICWITTQDKTAFSGPLRETTKDLINKIYETPLWATPPSPSAPRFDLLIDTRNRWKLARAARMIPHGTFIAMSLRYLFSDVRPPLFSRTPIHIVDRLLQMVTLAAGKTPSATGVLPVPDDLIAKARHLLPEGATYVGIAPGAGNKTKIWPLYKFEKVAAAQAAKGRVPVFLLGPQELAWQDALSTAMPSAIFPLQDNKLWGTSQLQLEHTLAIAKCLNVAVANDSGASHMLAAMDCPLVSLFGPTSAAKLAPRVSRSIIIRAQDNGSSDMGAIYWEKVDAAIDALLAETSP